MLREKRLNYKENRGRKDVIIAMANIFYKIVISIKTMLLPMMMRIKMRIMMMMMMIEIIIPHHVYAAVVATTTLNTQ